MAKLKRRVIGSLVKSKEPTKPNYLKINQAITLKEGQIVRAESKRFQSESLEGAVAAGKLKDPEVIAKMRERLEKMPDWVLADLVVLEEV